MIIFILSIIISIFAVISFLVLLNESFFLNEHKSRVSIHSIFILKATKRSKNAGNDDSVRDLEINICFCKKSIRGWTRGNAVLV